MTAATRRSRCARPGARPSSPRATNTSATSSGGNRPCATTPGVADEARRERGRVADRSVVVGDDAAVGAARHVAQRHRAEVAQGRRQSELEQLERDRCVQRGDRSSSSRRSRRSASAAAATIFSRVCAAPPPFTSQPSGAIWSAPSIVMSRWSSVANGSTADAERARPRTRCAGDVATQRDRQLAPRQRRQQVVHGRAGAEPDQHAVLDELAPRPRPRACFSLLDVRSIMRRKPYADTPRHRR